VICHITLHHQNKIKVKENQKKRNIKSKKIDKRKRKMLVSKHTIKNCLLEVRLVVELIVRVSSQLELLSVRTILEPEIGKTVQLG